MTSLQTGSNGISIIIPTYKRPEGIKTALESLMTQEPGSRPLEIIVADNDPKASAKTFVTEFARRCKIPVHYVHVPEPGVSNARNGAMKAARGRYRAFLDDDMEASSDWISALLKVLETSDAGVCFGPIDAVMPQPDDALNRFMSPYFSRVFDGPDGLTDQAFGMGGCMLDMERCALPSPPFNTDMNEIGGEDDWLFAHLMEQGTQMGWASNALTYEHVPESRLNLDYFWKRNFAYGQGPSQAAADKGLAGSLGVVKWMIVGGLQTLLFAPLFLGLKILNSPKSIAYHAKLAQGLGKIFWWDSFSPRMYGVHSNSKAA